MIDMKSFDKVFSFREIDDYSLLEFFLLLILKVFTLIVCIFGVIWWIIRSPFTLISRKKKNQLSPQKHTSISKKRTSKKGEYYEVTWDDKNDIFWV